MVSRSAPFWNFTRRRRVVCYRRFGITYRSHLQESSSPRRTAWPLKMGTIGCPKTSVTIYRSTLLKIPEERGSHLHCDGNEANMVYKTSFHKNEPTYSKVARSSDVRKHFVVPQLVIKFFYFRRGCSSILKCLWKALHHWTSLWAEMRNLTTTSHLVSLNSSCCHFPC